MAYQDTSWLRKKRREGKRLHCSVILNIANCKYPSVSSTARSIGWTTNPSDLKNWDVCWCDRTIGVEDLIRKAKFYQRINHFPAMSELYNKSTLARSLKKMRNIFPIEYDFYPLTWEMPAGFNDFLRYVERNPSFFYIVKPCSGSQGQGIYLTQSNKEISSTSECVVQHYLTNPLLVEGFKVDLRLYVLILSVSPLRLYMYRDGLVRLCTLPYSHPDSSNLDNAYMHLTNYSLNKDRPEFQDSADESSGSKRSLNWLWSWLQKQGHDTEKLWEQITDIVVKTILAVQPALDHNVKGCKVHSNNLSPFTCFELLGVDILLTTEERNCGIALRPHLIEVNHAPSLHIKGVVDEKVKLALLKDTLLLLGVEPGARAEYERRKVQQTKQRLYGDAHLMGDRETYEMSTLAENNTAKYFASLTAEKAWEKHLCRESEVIPQTSYRLLFPRRSEGDDHIESRYGRLQAASMSLFRDSLLSPRGFLGSMVRSDGIYLNSARSSSCSSARSCQNANEVMASARSTMSSEAAIAKLSSSCAPRHDESLPTIGNGILVPSTDSKNISNQAAHNSSFRTSPSVINFDAATISHLNSSPRVYVEVRTEPHTCNAANSKSSASGDSATEFNDFGRWRDPVPPRTKRYNETGSNQTKAIASRTSRLLESLTALRSAVDAVAECVLEEADHNGKSEEGADLSFVTSDQAASLVEEYLKEMIQLKLSNIL